MYANTIKELPVYQQIPVPFQVTLEELVAKLHSCGYADQTISFYEQAAFHFSFWLTKRGVSLSRVKEDHLADFLSRHLLRCQCPLGGVRQKNTVQAALGHFTAILKEAGYLTRPQTRRVSSIDLEIQHFDDYLLHTVGLQESTRLYRRRYVREFLQEFFPTSDVDPLRLLPENVITYLSKRGSGLIPASMKVLASSLRSYFRFLQLQSRCEKDFVLVVPPAASWQLASLPAVLTDQEIERLLSVFDRETAAGRRDYAITRCLVDLGLRAQEVARLRLDDLDWRRGILRIVATKSRRDDELPFTEAIGAAIVAYLRHGRPPTTAREVFLRVRPPVGQCVTRRTICDLILRAAVRAGMESTITGTRILRHTAATRMLRHGASIKEIADILRHRCLDTTVIYTKVDLARLVTVALPWPTEESR